MKTEKDFFIVGVGASAGGLDAVQQLFDNLPVDLDVAFVIIQHLSPDFVSLMPELLAKHTKMSIYTAEEGQEIMPNCVYLNQRNKNIGIKDNKFILFDKAPKNHLNLPIDILFQMLGEDYKEKAIGVILSGTGSDGSRGIKTIKEAGGIILVQDPMTAQFDGMPNSAILTNMADFVLSPAGIAEKIILSTNKRLTISDEDLITSKNEKIFKAILMEVEKYAGVDFKKYKYNTLLRRIEKQMSLHNIDSMDSYLRFVKENHHEKAALNQEFLIGVTNFFRDKEAFEIVKNKVIPSICEQNIDKEIVRVWIPGCSSGEEVYSLAILLDECIRINKLKIDFKIFATDIDKRALGKASMGSYTINNSVEIDNKYLEEYFLKTGDKIQIIKRLRDKIVFSYHDITKDPPFIKVDLISCRNMLIYFTNSTQKQILQNFQFSLNKGGFLFLGSSESLGSISSLFKVIDTKYKIFQNLQDNKRFIRDNEYSGNLNTNTRDISMPIVQQTSPGITAKRNNELLYYKYLSKKHAPVTVFVDSDFNVQFIIGEFKRWFSQTDGMFNNNLLNMIPADLATIIRNGVRRVADSGSSITINNLECKVGEGETIHTDLYFEKAGIADFSETIYLIQFGLAAHDNPENSIILSSADVSNFSKERINDLEAELRENRQELQNVVEELETSNEELQSSNEELMSSNEELQSSNEELQSVNEELYTVNTEFQEKNKELENLNNDINNLLNSIDVGTLFLDSHLNIRKFTPTIKRVFHLEDTDIGRSLLSFASEFDEETRKAIVTDAHASLESLQTFEKEIKDANGKWFLKRTTPFVTSEKKIDGVVITFVDITIIKKTKFDLINAEERLKKAMEAGNMAWWEMRLPSGEVTFDRKKVEMIGRVPEDFNHYQHFVDLVHPDDQEITMKAMKDHLEGKAENYDCEYRIKNNEGGYQWFHDVGRMISQTDNEIVVTGVVLEVTSKKEAELQLIEALKKAETANIYKNQFLANMSHEIRTPINGLLGFAEILRNDELDNETKNECINLIDSCSKQLLNLINDIIEVAKIEAGELSVKPEDCELNKIFFELEKTFENVRKQKGKNGLVIKTNIPNDIEELYIKTDPLRLKQILSNLIGNALKFTDSGEVEFGYRIEHRKIIIHVSDTGIGIPPDKLSLIFERFQQVEQKDKAKYDGTGLGLAICRGLVKLLGGKMQVSSEFGNGSRFEFDIPLISPSHMTKDETNKVRKDSKISFQGKTILVTEDDSVNQFLLKKLLDELPSRVLWANNGVEAVDIYTNHPEVALVLMDIRMPVMDGYEATKKILEVNSDARVIAQTAFAMSSDRDRCIQNGFVDYMSKPLIKAEFIETLGRWI
jgi:two-component system CheB/CheR fusion protein